MQYITLRIPIIDTGHDEQTKVEKMHEEIDELLNEFCIWPIDKPAAMSELFDVVQVMLGFILAGGKEILVGEDVTMYVEEFFRKSNEDHIEKMRLYAAERGWMV
ncbi:hypothetical protein HQN89_10785 [Paenibacillus frigoriresistens]|uniref:hypothetical protein n=1 Tax=Paenibacillus alginolyticus TaxID=59839 RepID=UPI001562EB37|nr:hypothetical protein [Paenibacillus frigoriresistens]NRF91504.1 hypothetical protein [Paenibacillus frigoriresistens]